MSLKRSLKRQKLKEEKPLREKTEGSDPLDPDALSNAATPWRRIFPWDFPGQLGDWSKKKRR